MSNILDVKVIKDFVRTCDDGWKQGWHERNGGNLTLRMRASEVEEVKPFFDKQLRDWVDIGVTAENLKNEYFITTGSGKFFRNAILNTENSIGILQINNEGNKYRTVWGLSNGAKPTSEFSSHFLNHSVKKESTNDEYRIIYHAHPTNLIALTFVLPLTDRDFSRILWKSATECPVVFPAGVGMVQWMVPGCSDIARASSKLMKKFDAIIWAHHGLFCSGPDLDTTFGLMHTIEKSAEIYIKAISCGAGIKQTITDDNLRSIANAFNVKINEDFLD